MNIVCCLKKPIQSSKRPAIYYASSSSKHICSYLCLSISAFLCINHVFSLKQNKEVSEELSVWGFRIMWIKWRRPETNATQRVQTQPSTRLDSCWKSTCGCKVRIYCVSDTPWQPISEVMVVCQVHLNKNNDVKVKLPCCSSVQPFHLFPWQQTTNICKMSTDAAQSVRFTN